MDELAIEYQTVLGLPPVEFVHLTADLGCRAISMKPVGGGGPYNPYGHEPFSLLEDVGLRRRLISVLHDRGVTISLGEGFVIRPGADIRDDLAGLDLMVELGAPRVNAVTTDPDRQRSLDQLAGFVELAADRGLETTVEFSPGLATTDLDSAVAVVRHVGRPDFRVLIDLMHVARSGGTPADLAALDPALVGYIHLSDTTVNQRNAVYRDDSSDRSAPGDGELPLVEFLLALPQDRVIGVEVPMRTRAAAGMPPAECARLAVAGGRRVLAEVSAARDRRRPVP